MTLSSAFGYENGPNGKCWDIGRGNVTFPSQIEGSQPWFWNRLVGFRRKCKSNFPRKGNWELGGHASYSSKARHLGLEIEVRMNGMGKGKETYPTKVTLKQKGFQLGYGARLWVQRWLWFGGKQKKKKDLLRKSDSQT